MTSGSSPKFSVVFWGYKQRTCIVQLRLDLNAKFSRLFCSVVSVPSDCARVCACL